MSTINSRTEYFFSGELHLIAPLHIGTGRGSEPFDAPLRRTVDGKLFIPGRALGGVLRNTATLLAPRIAGVRICEALLTLQKESIRRCNCPVCQLFGEIVPGAKNAKGEEYNDRASQLWIHDAFLFELEKQEPDTLLRDGVGINRSTRTAAKHAKFDHEIVPAGTVFDFALRWVDDEREGSDLRTLILASTLAEWQAGRVCLGGNRARGLGSFWLENLKVHKLQITAAEHLIEFLLEQTPVRSTGKTFIAHIDGWLETQIEKSKANIQSYTEVIAETRKALKLIDKKRDVDKLPDHIPLNRSFATVILKLAFDGPFLSNDPIVAARSGFDHAPMLDCIFDKAGNPFISGASLRGAIRSRAEKIARTIAMLKLGKIEQANYDEKRQEFLKSCPSCDPLVNNGDQPLANCDARWRKHDADGTRDSGETVTTFVETEHLCLSCRLFGSTRLGSRLRVSDATWVGKEPKADSWKIQDFLAIDRFIGGGLDGAKFDAAPLMDPEFTFSVTLQNPEAWELGWMALVLRDLCQGEVTIGFGAAKGYGRAKGDVVEWQIGHVRKDDFPADYSTLKSEILAAIEPASEGLFQVYSGTRGAGDAHWITQLDAWISEFDKKVKSYTATKPVEGNNAFDEEAPARPVPFDADTFLTDDGALFKLYGLPRIEEEVAK